MRRGRQRYDIYCATCHGMAGEGDGITSQLALEREEQGWVRPTALVGQAVRELPVGKLFGTITNGVQRTTGEKTNVTMPPYASQIPVEDRWAIVLYVRALQRSQNATMEDVPPERRKYLESTEPNDAGTPKSQR
jgi:mono/diheme cytochrome c family protein